MMNNQTGGASDRFHFSRKKEEKMEGFERLPCKIYLEKEGQLYEAIHTLSYDYRQTGNTVHVERKVITSKARPTSRMDLLKRFCK